MVSRLWDEGADYLQSATKEILQKIYNNFPIIHCSVTKITPHINGLLLVILQFFVWPNFEEFLLGEIFNNFTNIHESVTNFFI